LHGRGRARPVATNRNEGQAARDSAILLIVGQPTGNRTKLMDVPLTAKAVPRRLDGHHFGERTTNHGLDDDSTVVSVRFAAFNDTCR
jgi:hypothetical protein